MKKLFLALSVSAALSLPLCTYAQDRDDHHDRDDHRYYDKSHRDYHEWNDREDRAWHMYWEQHHHPYVAWDRANERQRDEYWNWRHNHSDAVLHIDIGH